MTDEVREWWENTAEYFREDIELDIGLNWTGFTVSDLGLLDEVDSADVLELGCGGGQCTVALATRGANVTGIDLSEAQLSHARNLADKHDVDIDFRQGDVTDLGSFENNSYDTAFNAWVFQWVEDLSACFAETYRVLRPGGTFVFSMPHPFYNIADPDTHAVEESYFNTGWHVIETDTDANQVTYRHTVSDIYNALSDAGFDVEQMLEPGSSDPDDYEMGPWEEYTPELMSKLPSTLIFRARKEA